MFVDIVKVGQLRCNCYLVEKEHKILIIDPGSDFDKIVTKVGARDVVGIIITHHHFDHDGASKEISKKYKCNIYDIFNLPEGKNQIANFTFNVIYTPGHKEDLITIYFPQEKVMFCGDFIFKDTIGRCDLEGGNINDMLHSLNKIKKYNRDIIIYPGHGEHTTLGYEIDNNIYFRDDIDSL